MAKNIVDLPYSDRPYEKLERIGSSNMTNSELLAIIIKCGTKRLNCLEIAQNILNNKGNVEYISDLEYLMSLSLEELKKYEGIGRVKAIQIQAVIEFSKRISSIDFVKSKKIKCPKDVYELLYSSYAGLKQECLKTIILNRQNVVVSIVTNFIGSDDKIDITLKEIFSEPLKQMASSIILVHNHPSGSVNPSKQDISFTKKIEEYSRIFNITLLDHIIIGKNNYTSLKESEYIK